MDVLVLALIVLGGIALEGFIFNRARKRAEYEETVARRLAHYAGAGRGREV
jgi:hypothetical protein